ncbi:MAP kinase [Myriangium duriaei CBS 260.36]|uniref:MAP kinase n=1 Tax=Myriangium duriaei CBS 260.36 TaxID=1168546 RepID=A0A9P4ML67_9PEZI|nr:MAP kinase [Myriangium duriaei CBS 260.36]
MSSDAFQTKTIKRKNKPNALALAAPKPTAAPSGPGPQEVGDKAGDERRGDTLEIGVEFRLDLRSEDLQVIKELGAGNGGTVSKVMHTATQVIMARKIIHVEAKKEIRKRIVRELQIMHECNSPNIVSFYGAFLNDSGDVVMCMEYMNTGSLDSISKNFGPVRVDVLGKIAEAILGGLTYLYRTHRIMHRDIKPSNVLVNSKGQIKLCDFGVSSELDNSVADTFVGTGTYMAPERIQGSPYSVKSDVWSVGLTLMELAIGKFPFSVDGGDEDDEAGGPQGILDLLQQIVLEPAPKLPKSDAFPKSLEDVIAKCLMKDPDARPTPAELYESDAFLRAAKRTPVNLEQWATSLMEKHNRKSQLAPPLSPSTRALLRGEDKPGRSAPPAADGTKSNGTHKPQPQASRSAYPERTSSAGSQGPGAQGPGMMSLPIRPAPGSTGPTGPSVRQGMRGSPDPRLRGGI